MNTIIIKNPRIPKNSRLCLVLVSLSGCLGKMHSSSQYPFAHSSPVVQGSPTNLPQCPSMQSLIFPFSLNTHLISSHLINEE